MTEIMTDMSDSSLTAAVEANLFGTWSAMKAAPQVEVYDGQDMIRYTSGVPFPLMNGVLRARFEPATADEQIEEALTHFRSRNLPMIWWTGPATKPGDLGARLEAHGLVHDEPETPGMALDLLTLNEDMPIPSGITIEPINDIETYRTYGEVLVAGFGMPDFVGQAFVDILASAGFSKNAPWRAYLGCLDDKPIATSLLSLVGGVAGIYNVATLAEARGTGIGAAMTLAPLREARQMGYRAGILQSSTLGVNVYRRLGFRECCKIGHYIWMPESK